MHVLMATLGSMGDLLPFLGLGLELRTRGHRVTFIASGAFEPLVKGNGFEFREVVTVEEYRKALDHPNLWSRYRSYDAFFRVTILPSIRRVYDAIIECRTPGQTVVAAPGYVLGARVACEKLDMPLATCHLAPVQFRSTYENRRLPPFTLPDWAPRGVKRALFALGDLATDGVVGPPLNALRTELGLPRVKRIVWHWWNSPQLILGLFPGWFARPQPDWPPQTRLTGFPLCEASPQAPLDPGLLRFLDSGDPPIVFTAGTGMTQGGEFFRTSLEACQALGVRGVFLTRYREQIPQNLPESVLHVDFAPFGFILPRAKVFVHHGGIGGMSHAIAAGVPQLVRPMAMDQPDNAYRMLRLGIGLSLSPRSYQAQAVAEALEQLARSAEILERCRHWAGQVSSEKAIGQACDHIEELGPKA